MAQVTTKLHECEHCELSYKSRGQKSNHKFSCHYGGYDCDLCPRNCKSREVLNAHYVATHGKKTDPKQDFGHLNRAQREAMDQYGLRQKQLGLPGIVLAKGAPPLEKESNSVSQGNEHPATPGQVTTLLPTVDNMDVRVNPEDTDIISIEGPVRKVESKMDMEDIDCTDVINLGAQAIASHETTCTIVDRLMIKDVRLGVNIRAELFQMANNAERMFDEGKMSVEEILQRIRPSCKHCDPQIQ